MRIERLLSISALLVACGSGGDAGDAGPLTPDADGGPASASDAAATQDALQAAQDAAQDAQDDAHSNDLASFDPPYPRVASYRIGGSQTYGPAFQTWASKQALVILGGNWEGWNTGGRDREAVVSGIKSQSTIGTKVLQYGDCDAVDSTQPASTWSAQVAKNNWYLYAQGTSGAKETNFYSASFWQTNSTTFVTPDSNGHTLEDAFAAYVDAEYRTGSTTNAAKSLDGHYHDNVFFVARTGGDFNRDGKTDAAKDYGLAWRTGLRRYFDEIAKIDPNLIRFANLDDMASLGITDPKDTAAAAPLDGILHGALFEGFMGASWSNETWAGWAATMNEYRFRENMTIAPHLAVVGHEHVAANGSDPTDATPYRAMRYGMASASLEDGYYAYSPPSGYVDTELDSFDELGGNAGGPPIGYLGWPTQAPPTAAWQKGVWRRDFDHGIVLVNPKGNGAQTVSLGGTFKHLTGKQNPALNDGSSVTSVTLADRDGLVLLK